MNFVATRGRCLLCLQGGTPTDRPTDRGQIVWSRYWGQNSGKERIFQSGKAGALHKFGRQNLDNLWYGFGLGPACLGPGWFGLAPLLAPAPALALVGKGVRQTRLGTMMVRNGIGSTFNRKKIPTERSRTKNTMNHNLRKQLFRPNSTEAKK